MEPVIQGKKTLSFQLTRPRKARRLLQYHLSDTGYFNSRAHARRDQVDQFDRLGVPKFQLTRPRKARHAFVAFLRSKYDFNSRAHARRDVLCDNIFGALFISTHAPTQGATYTCFRIGLSTAYFNSRAHARRDIMYGGQETYALISTHAPTQGATDTYQVVNRVRKISTHAPTQGATVLFGHSRRL